MSKGPEIATNLMLVPRLLFECLEQEVITGNDIIFNSFLYRVLPTNHTSFPSCSVEFGVA